jgi:hypothetical protein
MNLWDATLESKPAERESLKKTEEVDVGIMALVSLDYGVPIIFFPTIQI